MLGTLAGSSVSSPVPSTFTALESAGASTEGVSDPSLPAVKYHVDVYIATENKRKKGWDVKYTAVATVDDVLEKRGIEHSRVVEAVRAWSDSSLSPSAVPYDRQTIQDWVETEASTALHRYLDSLPVDQSLYTVERVDPPSWATGSAGFSEGLYELGTWKKQAREQERDNRSKGLADTLVAAIRHLVQGGSTFLSIQTADESM